MRAGDRVRTGDVQLGRLTLYQLSYSRGQAADRLVEGDGFEPSKAMPADLQSAPFGHSGNPPWIAQPSSIVRPGSTFRAGVCACSIWLSTDRWNGRSTSGETPLRFGRAGEGT